MVAPQKWWKMLFILKALIVLKIFKFLSWLFGHVDEAAWLENKVSFEIQTSQPG